MEGGKHRNFYSRRKLWNYPDGKSKAEVTPKAAGNPMALMGIVLIISGFWTMQDHLLADNLTSFFTYCPSQAATLGTMQSWKRKNLKILPRRLGRLRVGEYLEALISK